MPRFHLLLALFFSSLVAIACASQAAEPSAKGLTFEKDVLPIFRAKCLRCHAGVEPKAGLNLSRPSKLLSGGDSGPAIRIAAAEFSLLYEKIAVDAMPASGQKLTANEKGIIRTWINDGAKGVESAAALGLDDDGIETDLWSFQRVTRPPVPSVSGVAQINNAIDAFILRKLEKNSDAPSQQRKLSNKADRQTLLRRAYFDLIGLPPSPEEVQQFLADQRPDAYERMIERLLAHPNYGERWARHWLDTAGYAESAGVLYEDRPLQVMFRYRDYVIKAFNQDKPYDRFLQEQIAGDELTDYWSAYETMDRLPDEVVEGVTATGFLRTAPDPSRPDFANIKNASAQYYYPTLFDTLQIVCSTTMGLTVQCARCHSHKFDPIPQTDYYRMQAVFMTAYRPNSWIPQMKRRIVIASKSQKDRAEKNNAEVAANVKKLQGEVAGLKKQFTERLLAIRLAELPNQIRDDVKTALAQTEKKRTEVQKYLVEKFQKTLRPTGKELDAVLNKNVEFKTQLDKLSQQIAAEQRRHYWFDEVRALYDQPGAITTPVLFRGDPLTPGPAVEPGVLSMLKTTEPFDWMSTKKNAKTSGRRLAFARWLTQPDHPLTSRVMVNRIWMHHFGRGIVATPDDFGVSGDPPTHPELLDWLASEFVDSGWSIKHLHRLILSSRTWRQRSRVSAERRQAWEKADPQNRLLWRQSMRRLEAEPLRDAFLATSGLLNSTLYGASQETHQAGDGEVYVRPAEDRNRRSIYVKIRRLHPDTLLSAFDQPQIEINCTKRSMSTVSTQALTLLNSDFMVRASQAFAARAIKHGRASPAAYAVQAAFSRVATNAEQKLLAEFVAEQTQRHLQAGENAEQASRKAIADLCHMLLSANEFAYID